jgi:NAD-dependent SIR2 family protein deacetylase
MKRSCDELPNGDLETIEKGIAAVRSFRGGLRTGSGSREENLRRLQRELDTAEAVVVGAGSGLSTAAGYTYDGERFDRWFWDFAEKYRFRDMYSGGFTAFDSPEEQWGFFSRNIYVNRYMPTPRPVYERLLALVKEKDFFVITTNVDHCFQRSGFDKKRLFYTQGDYGLLQSSNPHGASAHKTYENEEIMRKMILAQGFEIGEHNELTIPEGKEISMRIPTELIPYCPDDGEPMTMNLRSDDKFVEDEGWHQAAERYSEFLRRHENLKVLFLEAAVGMNTPSIIKFQFWKIVNQWPDATYACLNYGEAYAPDEIINRSICINGDIREILMKL